MRALYRFATLLLLAGACGDAAESTAPTGSAESTTATSTAEQLDLVADCNELASLAEHTAADAALLPWLCPDQPLSPSLARAVLLQVDTITRAASIARRLDGYPDLQALARLAARAPAQAEPIASLPELGTLTVSPVTDSVLAHAELAHAMLIDPAITHDDRLRARTYLHKLYFQALQQLGLPSQTGSLPPFGRLLASRAVHHGRELCRSYWQKRVAGLESSFAETEMHLLQLVLALERTSHAADDGLTAVERQRGRRYLQSSATRKRIARRQQRDETLAGRGTVSDLLPLANELDRLMDHGFVDLAISRALYVGAEPNRFGVGPAGDFIAERLFARGLAAYEPLLSRRLRDIRNRDPKPVEVGANPIAPAKPADWPTSTEIGARVIEWIGSGHAASGFRRTYALARAVEGLQRRPDASLEATDLALAQPHLRRYVPLLRAAAGDRETARGVAELRQSAKIAMQQPDADTDALVRRGFSVVTHDAGHHAR